MTARRARTAGLQATATAHGGHLEEINLSTGHLIRVTTAQPPVMGGGTAGAAR